MFLVSSDGVREKIVKIIKLNVGVCVFSFLKGDWFVVIGGFIFSFLFILSKEIVKFNL